MRTATFRLGRYDIMEDAPLEGLCELPEALCKRKRLAMSIQSGDSYKALVVALEEMLHAEQVPDKWVHSGTPERLARALRAMGWRRVKGKS